MKKSDIIEILVEEYGLKESELKEKKINELKKMLDELDAKAEQEKEKRKAKKESVEKPKRKQALELDRKDLIPVINYFNGVFVHTSQDGLSFYMSKFGDREEIPFGELARLKNRHNSFLMSPVLYIDDEEAVEALSLKGLYENIVHPESLVDFLINSSVEELEQALEKAPKGAKETMLELARNEIKNGRISDLNKVRMLQVKFDLNVNVI